jgi:hypothetical protein
MATQPRSNDNAPKEAKAVKATAEGKPTTASLRGSVWLPTNEGRFLARAAAVAGLCGLKDGTTAVLLFGGHRVVVKLSEGAVDAALAKVSGS